MGTEIACRAKVQLLLIECKPNMNGDYFHTAFEGSRRVVSAGFSGILSPEWCEAMRQAPIMFISRLNGL